MKAYFSILVLLLCFFGCIALRVSTQCPPWGAGVGTITGPGEPCDYDTITYSVTPHPSITYYEWMLIGWGNIISGQGTTTITVRVDGDDWTLNPGAPEIEVRGLVPACGSAYLLYATYNLFNFWYDPGAPSPISNVSGLPAGTATCTGVPIYRYAVDYWNAAASCQTFFWSIPVVTGGTVINSKHTWIPGPGLWTHYFDTVTVNWTTPGTGKIVWNYEWDCHSCYYPAVLNVTVTSGTIPTPVITPPSPVLCPGGPPLTLDAGSGYAGYVWSTGATSSTITPAASGTYSVIVKDPVSFCPGFDTVTVTSPPPVVITPVSPVICAGSTVTLDAGPGYASYSWSTGASTQTINVSPGVTTTYSVTVTGVTSCPFLSASKTVIVNPAPSPSITPSGPTTFCTGGSVTLNAGSGYSSYLWSTGATTSSINVTASGSYSVTVTNSSGCSGSAGPVSVTVNPLPAPSITPSGPTVFCAGGSVTLDAGSGYSSYLWNTGATSSSINVSASGTYSVTVTNSFGCSGSTGPVSITVNPLPVPVIAATSGGGICAGGSVTLSLTSGFASYMWSTGSVSSSISVSTPGVYSVTVTDGAGCTGSDDVTVVVPSTCSVPAGLYSTVAGSTSATLFWTEPPCANKYSIRYRKLSGGPWTNVTVSSPATSYTVTGLAANTTYLWQIRAQCKGLGASTYSPLQLFTTPLLRMDEENAGEEEKVSAEGNLTLWPNPGNGTFQLSWVAETEGPATICIFDISGKRIFCKETFVQSGVNVQEFSIDVSSGLYHLTVECSGKMQTLRLVVHR